ncbi:MAG: TdeIII family type II restriction endonuclease [Nitrospirota bacterium]
MVLSLKIRNEIIELLKITVREKLKDYRPETVYMPFHHRLLGKDRYAMFSFIHSINTTFGMSIWEQVAVILAKGAGTMQKDNTSCLAKWMKTQRNLSVIFTTN